MDVELARIHDAADQRHDAADQRRFTNASHRERFKLLDTSLRGARICLWIVTAAVPLQVVERIARDIAGKQTSFIGTVSVSVAISVLVSIGWTASATQSYQRKKKVKRLRDRADRLEAQLFGAQFFGSRRSTGEDD